MEMNYNYDWKMLRKTYKLNDSVELKQSIESIVTNWFPCWLAAAHSRVLFDFVIFRSIFFLFILMVVDFSFG